jgi:hypothetical protein
MIAEYAGLTAFYRRGARCFELFPRPLLETFGNKNSAVFFSPIRARGQSRQLYSADLRYWDATGSGNRAFGVI